MISGAGRRFDYIDGVRGWAILLVVMVHSSQTAPALEGAILRIAVQGARGVQLFYVASAVTLLMAWHARGDGLAPFYLCRLFRIAPMFWLAIPFFLVVDGTGPSYWAPDGIHLWQIAATATFLHGFHPQSITSVVPGGWSIAVETTFYALFPLLAGSITSLSRAVAALGLSLWFAEWLYPIAVHWWPAEDRGLAANYAFLWFPNQLPCFMAGFVGYFVIRDVPLPRRIFDVALAISLTAMVLLAFFPVWIQTHLAYGLAFSLFVVALSGGAGTLLNSWPVRYLGRISFSAYLWQFALLALVSRLSRNGIDPFDIENKAHGLGSFLVAFLTLIAMSAMLSAVTYRFIEIPMIKRGAQLIASRRV